MSLTLNANALTLPQETIYHIGSFLCNSRRDLQMCSLTSRSWHSGVQSHLYRSITLDSEEKVAELETLVREHPTVACWIQELRVTAFTKSTRWHANPESWTKWISRITDELPAKLINLHSMELVGLHNPYLSGNHRSSCNFRMAEVIPRLGLFSTVQSLAFFRCELDDDVADCFISAYPHLQRLSLRKSLIMSTSVRMHLPNIRPPRLTTLYVDDNHDSLRKLRLSDSFESLRDVTILVSGQENLGAVKNFVSQLGSSVKALSLFIEDENPASPYPLLPNLTGLCTLRLSPLIGPHTAHILSTVQSQTLDHVVFSVTPSCLRTLAQSHSQKDTKPAFHPCLLGAALENAKTVSFVHPELMSQSQVEDALFRALPPSMCKKGVVRSVKAMEPVADIRTSW
ncbi:hypothetical protein BXZ70DRAFT_87877 [Cristinia sonorae]|uniref:F-box domain-containing protein n=1 Tax=Cristinia sonorae TaxID=1940300 RepID=A0A8K0US54_9AGAR|nr:hypothetical protein BXZ70DRAFT_87877 [Cristinia sonorae]